MCKKTAISMALMAGLMGAGLVQAAVTAEQAEALKTTLTPLGGSGRAMPMAVFPSGFPTRAFRFPVTRWGIFLFALLLTSSR